MRKKLDHIGIAVRDLESSLSFYMKILDATLIDRYTSTAKGVES